MARLNRVVAVQKVYGAKKALESIEEISKDYDYKQMGLFYAIKAELLDELGHPNFKSTLKKAIALTQNQLVRKHLEKKLN